MLPRVFVGLFVEAEVCVGGPYLLADLIIGLVLAPTRNRVTGSS